MHTARRQNERGLRPTEAAAYTAIVLGCLLGLTAATEAPPNFEVPPLQPASELLQPALASGADFHVVDPVQSDGLMHRYVVDSKFGQFPAYGRVALAIRVHEVAALTELNKTSPVAVVAGGVSRGVESQVETAVGVVTHPVKAVTGIPRGIAHLFHGYVDEGKETVADAKRSTSAPAADGSATTTSASDKSASAAKHYAARYFGLTGAERHWYEKLGVDPYTDNAVLREAIHKTAKIDAAAGFGTRFIGIPSIPGIGDIHQVMDAVYKEDPATIRARTKVTLAGYGLEPAEIDRWQNAIVLSPTRQLLLLNSAAALDGVDGRAELFRHALGLKSVAEAQVYLQSVALLVVAHRKQPVAAILPGVRLPAAKRADGHVIVCGAFEAVYWTEDVARGEGQIREALQPAGDAVRELWVTGTVSDTARNALQGKGWDIHEGVSDPSGDPPTH